MGVYIDMEMPKNGSSIQIAIDDDGKVYPSVEKCILKMSSIAKAVPVPPHGRLGDLDRLAKEVKDMVNEFPQDSIGAERYRLFAEFIRTAPTIIPASEEE